MGQVPAFPDFVPLDISHREIVDSALASERPEVSELNFAEIFAWHGVRQTQISDLEGALCLFIKRHGKRCFYPPLQAPDPPAAMRNMLLWLRNQGEEGFVYGLTGRQAAGAEATGELVAEEDPDNADYVYRTQDLIQLPGHKYDGKRNHIHNFVRSYDFTYAEIDPRTLPEVVDFQRRWFAARMIWGSITSTWLTVMRMATPKRFTAMPSLRSEKRSSSPRKAGNEQKGKPKRN